MEFCSFHPDAILPTRATEYSAGFDLASVKTVQIIPGKVCLVPTGIGCKLPRGFYGQIALRSGWSTRNNCVYTAGVIDRDYKGEVFVAVITLGNESVTLEKGTKFAQLIPHATFDHTTTGPRTFSTELRDHPGDESRHEGFGSTGK